MRVFKWTVDFQVLAEPSIILAWIGLEGLPIHYFNKSSLFSIASAIGQSLKIDEPTACINSPSIARVFVEIDLVKLLPSRV